MSFKDEGIGVASLQPVAEIGSLSRTPFPSCLSSVRITHYNDPARVAPVLDVALQAKVHSSKKPQDVLCGYVRN